ncbi:uncharacterized protein LOC123552739 [Mercenaria mercenaria]|uniref:uncharacterized protein LOC123552739 n=1 Tax=Mercenaria mercenaria TaxID=6596 RepID=UPI001E1DD76D|nr:uncharacterized protein LOC123552739 [Mercenaria mercenaria]
MGYSNKEEEYPVKGEYPANSQFEDKWASCLQTKNESQIRKLLLDKIIPKSANLDVAYSIFEHSYDLLGEIFALVSEYIKNKSPDILGVYAAYDDRKNSEKRYCFLVFTKQSATRPIHLKVKYPIKIVCADDCSQEDENVVKEILKSYSPSLKISQEESKLNKCVSEHSERLMKETKNITLITTCMYKSQNYQLGKPLNLLEIPCIVILVMQKYWIPIGSKPLPEKLNGISVDVREGIAVQFTGKLPTEKYDNVRIGCKIESSLLQGSDHPSRVCNEGTLGGFILGTSSKIYGFTCAHILFPEETLQKMQKDEQIYVGKNFELNVRKPQAEISSLNTIVKCLEERKVYQTSCEQNDYFGTVELALYVRGGSYYCTGVDFALLKIDDVRVPNTTEFPYVNKLRTSDRETEGASVEREFHFNSGKVIEKDLRHGDKVIKYGCKTLLTEGIFRGKNRFKFLDGEMWHGQCEIIAESGFAEPSDSGSLVFKQNDRDLEAAGILVGGTTARFAVTSFPDIIETTGLGDIKFLKFDGT